MRRRSSVNNSQLKQSYIVNDSNTNIKYTIDEQLKNNNIKKQINGLILLFNQPIDFIINLPSSIIQSVIDNIISSDNDDIRIIGLKIIQLIVKHNKNKIMYNDIKSILMNIFNETVNKTSYVNIIYNILTSLSFNQLITLLLLYDNNKNQYVFLKSIDLLIRSDSMNIQLLSIRLFCKLYIDIFMKLSNYLSNQYTSYEGNILDSEHLSYQDIKHLHNYYNEYILELLIFISHGVIGKAKDTNDINGMKYIPDTYDFSSTCCDIINYLFHFYNYNLNLIYNKILKHAINKENIDEYGQTISILPFLIQVINIIFSDSYNITNRHFKHYNSLSYTKLINNWVIFIVYSNNNSLFTNLSTKVDSNNMFNYLNVEAANDSLSKIGNKSINFPLFISQWLDSLVSLLENLSFDKFVDVTVDIYIILSNASMYSMKQKISNKLISHIMIRLNSLIIVNKQLLSEQRNQSFILLDILLDILHYLADDLLSNYIFDLFGLVLQFTSLSSQVEKITVWSHYTSVCITRKSINPINKCKFRNEIMITNVLTNKLVNSVIGKISNSYKHIKKPTNNLTKYLNNCTKNNSFDLISNSNEIDINRFLTCYISIHIKYIKYEIKCLSKDTKNKKSSDMFCTIMRSSISILKLLQQCVEWSSDYLNSKSLVSSYFALLRLCCNIIINTNTSTASNGNRILSQIINKYNKMATECSSTKSIYDMKEHLSNELSSILNSLFTMSESTSHISNQLDFYIQFYPLVVKNIHVITNTKDHNSTNFSEDQIKLVSTIVNLYKNELLFPFVYPIDDSLDTNVNSILLIHLEFCGKLQLISNQLIKLYSNNLKSVSMLITEILNVIRSYIRCVNSFKIFPVYYKDRLLVLYNNISLLLDNSADSSVMGNYISYPKNIKSNLIVKDNTSNKHTDIYSNQKDNTEKEINIQLSHLFTDTNSYYFNEDFDYHNLLSLFKAEKLLVKDRHLSTFDVIEIVDSQINRFTSLTSQTLCMNKFLKYTGNRSINFLSNYQINYPEYKISMSDRDLQLLKLSEYTHKWIDLSTTNDLIKIQMKGRYNTISNLYEGTIRLTNTSGVKIPIFKLHVLTNRAIQSYPSKDNDNQPIYPVLNLSALSETSIELYNDIISNYLQPYGYVDRNYSINIESIGCLDLVLRIEFCDLIQEDNQSFISSYFQTPNSTNDITSTGESDEFSRHNSFNDKENGSFSSINQLAKSTLSAYIDSIVYHINLLDLVLPYGFPYLNNLSIELYNSISIRLIYKQTVPLVGDLNYFQFTDLTNETTIDKIVFSFLSEELINMSKVVLNTSQFACVIGYVFMTPLDSIIVFQLHIKRTKFSSQLSGFLDIKCSTEIDLFNVLNNTNGINLIVRRLSASIMSIHSNEHVSYYKSKLTENVISPISSKNLTVEFLSLFNN